MNLENSVAWITGGNRMGLAVARVLSQRGCRIAFSYRSSKQSAEDSANQIIQEGGDAATYRCDLAQRNQIEKTAQAIARHFKHLNVLINLSSIYERASLADRSAWQKHLQTNAESAFNLSVAVAPWMQRAGEGRIVHISDWTSASGRPRYKDYAAYYVSKAAIKAVVEAMALELAPKISVNAIAPGPILAPKGTSKREFQAVIDSTPLKRWGGAEEIAKAALFLVQSDFVTGETLRVDGGRHLY